MSDVPVSRINTNPAHSAKFVVDHKAKSIGHIRFVSGATQAVLVTNLHAFFDLGAKSRHKLRVRAVHFEELLLLLLVVHNRVSFHYFDFKDCIPGKHCFVE